MSTSHIVQALVMPSKASSRSGSSDSVITVVFNEIFFEFLRSSSKGQVAGDVGSHSCAQISTGHFLSSVLACSFSYHMTCTTSIYVGEYHIRVGVGVADQADRNDRFMPVPTVVHPVYREA